MKNEKSPPVSKQEEGDSDREGFFQLYGISKEEEQFFKAIYRRRQTYRLIIAILVGVIAVLLGSR